MTKIIFSILMLIGATMPIVAVSQNNIDEISKRYAALPNLYHFDAIPKEQLSDKITRQYVMGSKSMLVKWTLKKGALIGLHFNTGEQTTWIIKGSVKVLSQGKTWIVKAGEILIIPPYVPHEFYALEDTIDIDFFTPVRDDWLNNTATYIKKT